MDGHFPPPANPKDPGRRYLILGVTWALTALCILVVTARFYLRAFIIKSLSSDDWIMLAAVLGQIGSQVCVTIASYWGLGMHDADLSFYPNLINVLKWLWFSLIPGTIGTVLARISIALLLIRLFGTKIWFRYFLIITNVLQASFSISLLVIIFTSVSPLEGLWNPHLPAKRLDPHIQGNVALVAQSLLAFADLTYVLIPITIVWRLNMSKRQKFGLSLLLAFSLGTLAASIAKAITSDILNTASDPTSGSTDLQYMAASSNLIGNIEQSLVVILGCVPPLRPITKLKIFQSVTGWFDNPMKRMAPSRGGRKSSALDDNGFCPPYYKPSQLHVDQHGRSGGTCSDQELILQGTVTNEAHPTTVSYTETPTDVTTRK
ncbi:hypothetical protein F4678DRAFT_454617 [Xylaria arbuscula]|nr:hypothetical protein F4678DRAFT_454617 [Xylaria arbuscula]